MIHVNHTYEEVVALSKSYLTSESSLELINKAYLYASKSHEGQFRRSGEPYIYHLLNVAYILVELQAGPTTIAAGFLHDTIEDCGISKEQLSIDFNLEVAELVEAVTKVGQLAEISEEEFQAENHRKIFIAMAKDIRVIIIKLADRLHNMRTLDAKSIESQKRISKETLEVYAPIAHRLGINTIKSELEDLALYYLEHEKFVYISSLLKNKENERETAIEVMKTRLTTLLNEQNIPFSMSGRVKNIYSIYKKMYIKNKNFDEIYDLQALRIITDTTTQCYEVLGYIHATYRPIPGRFKDYIAMPKPNLYQSLHTTIVADDGNIFEIQIRTHQMDEIAETGVAAHWRYKENSNYNPQTEQREIEEKLHWFRDLISITSNEEDSNAKDYMASLQKDIFEANVYVLTPKGRVIDLPTGSTPLDFAYKIHTGVGNSTIGASINGVLSPLSTILKTGDVVDIKTSKTNTLPNEDWLKIVKTSFARNQIKKALLKYNNELRRDEIIDMGKEVLNDTFRNDKSLDPKEIIRRIEDRKFLDSINMESIDALYMAIAHKSINVSNIIGRVKEEERREKEYVPFAKKKVYERNPHSMGIIVPGIDTVAVSFSQCCSPIPGDDIVGYISKGQGVKIHRANCPNIQGEKQRIIPVEWDYEFFKDNPKTHYADIQIKAADKISLLVDIMNFMSSQKVPVNSVNLFKQESTLSSFINLCIEVNDLDHLNCVINALKTNVSGIIAVNRISKN